MTFEEWWENGRRGLLAEREARELWCAAYQAGMERAAEICKTVANEFPDEAMVDSAAWDGAWECERTIRAEAGTPKQQEGGQ